MKTFLLIFIAMVLASNALANSICRQIGDADFGSEVSSRIGNRFVITRECEKNYLVAKKPVRLSIHLSPDAGTAKSTTTKHSPTLIVFFSFNKADLDDSDRLIMNQVPHGSSVRITGYTCSIGSEDYNARLSLQRAEVVADYLQSRYVKIISVNARGECCPVSTTDLAKNRRVLIEEEK